MTSCKVLKFFNIIKPMGRFLPTGSEGQSKHVSGEIIADFLYSNEQSVKLDKTHSDVQDRRPHNVYVSLRSYVERYGLPVKVTTKAGDIFLERTDASS